MTGALGAGLLFWGVRALVRRWPFERDRWGPRVPLYLIGLLVYGTLQTTFMWGSREALYRLVGLGDYDYGVMPIRYAMELPVQAIAFTLMVAALHAVAAYRRAREREVREAELARGLAEAKLRNLRLQLQPHFLFNALNTVSATMYRDPEAADEILERLAELLRASLATERGDEVTLGEEAATLDAYLAILAARFGDRVRVATRISPEARPALVPAMILQPLVENAVRHGKAAATGEGVVEVRAARSDGRLVLEVEDDGPGVIDGRDPLRSGLGLSTTLERLRLLYGEAQTFTAGNAPGGGFLVRATLPFHTREGVA
jgi:LytS/YehU family sensor histidine kinase